MQGIRPDSIERSSEVVRKEIMDYSHQIIKEMHKQAAVMPSWQEERGLHAASAVETCAKLRSLRETHINLVDMDEAGLLFGFQLLYKGRYGGMLRPFFMELLAVVRKNRTRVCIHAHTHRSIARVWLNAKMNTEDIYKGLIGQREVLCEHIRGREQHEME